MRLTHTMGAALIAAQLFPTVFAEPTEHNKEPATGIESWRIEPQGFEVSLTQILPDQARAFMNGRNFPAAATERFATACVYMTVVRNKGETPVDFALANWRVLGVEGVDRLKPKLAWMEEWAEMGLGQSQMIAFEWSQFPLSQSFAAGDWNQGMTTIMAKPGQKFDVEVNWTRNGQSNMATLKGVRCANQ